MSTQPRRSPRLLAAEWKANAAAYHTRRNASRVPAGPPNTFVSTVPSPAPIQAPAPVPESTPPPRRSARLAKKRLENVLPKVIKTIIPSFKHLEQTKDTNNRAHIISNIFDDLITDPMILILQPKLRNTISGMLIRLREDVHTCPNLTHHSQMRLLDYMNRLTTAIQIIRSHPYYVA